MDRTFASTRRARPYRRSVNGDSAAERSETAGTSALKHATEVEHLRSRIAQLQGTSLGSRLLPTFPGLGQLLPGGGIKRGCSYSAVGSTALALSLLAGPAGSGAWSAVVGLPGLNPEAAAEFGIPLERLVLIPNPGQHWFSVVSALTDIMGAILVGPVAKADAAGLDRLSARLRDRGTVLINVTPWGRAEAQLRLEANHWQGLDRGCGHLTARNATVCSRWHNGTSKRAEIRLPGPTPAQDNLAQPTATAQPSPIQPTAARPAGTDVTNPEPLGLVTG